MIADSPKGKIKGQTIVVGAHLDSVIAGPGINDNGSGTSTILEIAEQLAALRYTKKLQRQVRFAFWGAEEPGLLGSEYYVNSLSEAQQAKIYANLNFDMVGSPNYVRFVYDGDGSDTPDPPGPLDPTPSRTSSPTTSITRASRRSRPPSMAGPTTGRSSRSAFRLAGSSAALRASRLPRKPRIYGGTAGEAYDACYHQACDTINNLNTKALSELGDAAADATLTLALSKTGLFPDGSRHAQVKVTGKAAKRAVQARQLAISATNARVNGPGTQCRVHSLSRIRAAAGTAVPAACSGNMLD